jgi:hypothetical protein
MRGQPIQSRRASWAGASLRLVFVMLMIFCAAGQVSAALRAPEAVPLDLPATNVTAEGIFHFPLQVGNHWLYEKRYPHGYETTWEVSVVSYSDGTANGTKNEGVPARGFALKGYFGDGAMVDYGAGGELMEITADGEASLWYRLGASTGTEWILASPENSDPCIDGVRAVLASHEEFVQVPAGEFSDAVRVDYEPRCMDAGLISEWFAAGVGLVKRTEESIAGPIESVLLASQVGGLVLPDHPAATSLTLDRAMIPMDGGCPGAKLQGAFRIHEQNTDGESFVFAGCVSATLVLVNNSGKLVLERSVSDGGCCLCKNLVYLDLHGRTLTLPFAFDLVDPDGKPLPEGHYSLKATLDSLDVPDVKPAATAHFHVGAR